MENVSKTALDVHFNEIRSDLSQVDKVLEDAVTMLFGAFSNVANLIRLQQRINTQVGLIHQAAELNHPATQHPPGWIEDENEPALARRDPSLAALFAQQATLGDQLECQVNAVVQSLQFQDLASQLLAHALKHLAVVESLVGSAEGAISSRKRRHGGPAAACDAQSARGDSLADVIAFPRSRAAGHRGMQAGDIELF